ncbi:MAG TPA: hypothetical protein VNM47_18015 [Terriglobia bacterium]|nr:hypothetical protein [Terriglobia bacterium]
MRLRYLLVLIFGATTIGAMTFARAPQKLSNLPITTMLLGEDSSGLMADIRDDGLGAYHDGMDSVTSFLTTNGYNGIVWGDWQFGTLSSTSRKLGISFENPIPTSSGGTATPNPPFNFATVIAHIEDKCTMISYSMISMTAGQSFPCPAIVHFFTSAGEEYRIYMAPNWSQPPTPETTFVEVTCNAVAPDGCNDWYIDPIPASMGGNPSGAIGELVDFGCPSCPKPKGGHTTSTTGNKGDYFFKFHFHLTRP